MSDDLTTLAKAKRFLQISGADDDDLIKLLIASTTVLVATYLNRNLLMSGYQERYSGAGSTRLLLRQTPVQSVISLTINGVIIPASDGVSLGYRFDDLSITLVGRVFSHGINNVEADYVAGFDDVPADIELAVLDTVAREYRERQRIGKKSDAQPQGGNTTYDTAALSERAKLILGNYQRRIPI